VLECSGAPGAAATVICPTATKLYVIKNSVTGGYAVTLKTSAGSGISVPNGSTALLYCDGTNVVSGATYMATVSTTQVDILAQGDLRLQDTTGGEYVALQAPATIAASYTLTLPVDDGTAGQALVTDGNGVLSWSSAASGDVYGPASATDKAIATYNGTTGKIIQDNPSVTITSNVITALGFTGPHNGTVGATTPSTGAFTTLSGTGQLTLTNASDYNLYASGAGGNYMAGKLGIGDLPSGNGQLRVAGAVPAVTDSWSVISQGSSQASSTHNVFYALPTVSATSTLNSLTYFYANQSTFSNTVNNQHGFRAESTLTGATNNYGFYGNIASGTGRWNFYANGTAANYFAGNVGIGTPSPTTKFEAFASANSLQIISSVRNDQAGSGVAAIGFNVSSSAAADTSAVKAGIGLVRQNAQGVGSLNFYNRASTDTSSFTSSDVVGAISPAGVWSLGAAPGSESLRVTPVASAVNYWNAQGNATGAGVQLLAQGSDANISAYYAVKGSGSHVFWDNVGATHFVVARTASAVDYLQVTGSASGFPQFTAQGASANVSIVYTTKGAGGHSFNTGASNLQFNIASTASAVNYLQVTGSATGGYPVMLAQGSDTDIGLFYYAKGNAGHWFRSASGSNTQFVVAPTASAVNYLQVTGGATGSGVTLSAQGSDANINTTIASKGSGGVQLNPANQGTPALVAAYVASPVNYALVYPSTTGNAVQFGAQGSDTNINLYLSPKGSGLVQFGTYTAGIVAQAGYITIADAAGNTRRLLVG
jgi:hypothetical protein